MMKKIRSWMLILSCFAVILLTGSLAMAAEYQKCSGYDYWGTFAKTMREYVADGSCWFCPIFTSLFDAINNMVTTIFDELADDFLGLMGGGILFVILFKVAKILVSLQEVDVIQFLNDLFKPLGRAIIATALLGGLVSYGGDNVFSLITNPVLDTSLILGQQVMAATTNQLKEFELAKLASNGSGKYSLSYSWEAKTCGEKLSGSGASAEKKALTTAEKELMSCWMEQVASSFIAGIALGGSMMSVAVSGSSFFDWGFSLFLSGLFIWLAFYILYLTFPIRVVDAFVRMAFVLALMPLWVILWVFPATQQYTKKAWNMFLSSCMLFIILGIMIGLVVQIMDNAIPNTQPAGAPDTIRRGLIACMKSGNDEAAITWVQFGGGAILNTLAFGAISFSLLGAAATLANTLADGAGADLGVGAGMASTAAKGGMLAWSGAKMVGKGGMVVGGAAAKGLASLPHATQSFFGDKLGWSNAGGAIPTTGDKIKRAFTNPISDLFKSKPESTPYDPATAGDSFAGLTGDAQQRVGMGADHDVRQMKAAVLRGDETSLQRMVNTGSAEERAVKARMIQDMRKPKLNPTTGRMEKGVYSETDLKALKDVRANEERTRNVLADKNRNDEALKAKVNRDGKLTKDDRQKIADFDRARKNGESFAVNNMSRIESMAKMRDHQYDQEASQMFNTKAERDAADKFRATVQANGGVVTDEAKKAFVAEMGVARAEAVEGPLSAQQKQAYQEEKATANLNSSQDKVDFTKNLATNMEQMSNMISTCSSKEQMDQMLASGQWSGVTDASHKATLDNFARNLYEAKQTGSEENVRRTMNTNLTALFQNQGGMGSSDSSRLAAMVTNESAHGVMTGVTGSKGAFSIAGGIGSLLSKENLAHV